MKLVENNNGLWEKKNGKKCSATLSNKKENNLLVERKLIHVKYIPEAA